VVLGNVIFATKDAHRYPVIYVVLFVVVNVGQKTLKMIFLSVKGAVD
jgi:hypothetical protein